MTKGNLGLVLKAKQKEIEGRINYLDKWIEEGYVVVPNVLILDKEISCQAKTVFLALCVHAFKKEYAFPSYQVLSEEVGLARPQLIRYIKELVEVGLIRVERTGRANNYTLVYDAISDRVEKVKKRLKKLKAEVTNRNNAK
jgi:predicted transcriptional regulator